MNPPAATPASRNLDRAPSEVRGPELGPALKRDRLLQRVRAARKRLTPGSSGALARLR